MDSLEELREARYKLSAVFMQFADDSSKFPQNAFCFFEGEDGKYYNPRIKRYFGNRFFTYKVGNKNAVLQLREKIVNDALYDRLIKMFFVDKDFDLSVAGISKNLYETPCYSIENLYAQTDVFKDILKTEFGINQLHPDYIKCITDFEQRLTEFTEAMIEFNALALLRKRLKKNLNVDKVKTNHLFKVSIYKIEKARQYNDAIDGLKVIIEDEEEKKQFQECINELKMGKKELIFRGKNQLDCFCMLVKELKELNKSNMYFSQKYSSVNINITNNRLSELSQYAITPPELVTFLLEHSKLLLSYINTSVMSST